ncbi:ZinT/AdcA family metal-binding protein, partial [Pantoea agglomerans]|uniref:ZinT/AdcA family metal-binding protein n=1 Tax=Enterobacter agglomerans TaxID=549 RepID=UPI001F5D5246
YKAYYRKGYATDVDTIGIENGVMEFHIGDQVSACHYRYAGLQQFGGGQRSSGGFQQAQRGPTLEDACSVLGVKSSDDATTI